MHLWIIKHHCSDSLSNSVSMELKYYTQEETIGQTRNHKWYEARKGRLTASKFYEICHTRNINKLCLRYRSQNGEENSAVDNVPAIKYGIDMEPYIFEYITLYRDYFKQVENQVVTECGLFIHPERNFLAASPDGLQCWRLSVLIALSTKTNYLPICPRTRGPDCMIWTGNITITIRYRGS